MSWSPSPLVPWSLVPSSGSGLPRRTVSTPTQQWVISLVWNTCINIAVYYHGLHNTLIPLSIWFISLIRSSFSAICSTCHWFNWEIFNFTTEVSQRIISQWGYMFTLTQCTCRAFIFFPARIELIGICTSMNPIPAKQEGPRNCQRSTVPTTTQRGSIHRLWMWTAISYITCYLLTDIHKLNYKSVK